MVDHKEELIKIPTHKTDEAPRVPNVPLPVEEHKRLKDDEIQIERCTANDMPAIVR